LTSKAEIEAAICRSYNQWLIDICRKGENGFMRFKVPVLSGFHSIVHDGIPAKFPQLRFGFIEVRAQWVPYMAVEIAKRFERENKVMA
jgi:hypothetical protein